MPSLTHTLDRMEFARLQSMTPSEAALVASGGCGCEGPDHRTSEADFALDNLDPAPTSVTWSGVICTEGELTGDGRLLERNSLAWEELPIPLRYVSQDVGAHDGATVVGRILTLTRMPNGDIAATGDFDLDSSLGAEALRVVSNETQNGVSVDLDNVSFEVRVAQELVEEVAPGAALEPTGEIPVKDVDADGRVTVMKIAADEEVMAVTSARIRAATLVAIPAFANAKIKVEDPAKKDDEEETEDKPAEEQPAPPEAEDPNLTEEERKKLEEEQAKKKASSQPKLSALRASAYPAEPPREWFSDPKLDGPTPLTVTRDGRVYGHLAVWGTCHTGNPGQCVTPPESRTNYAYFRTGAVLCADGSEVAVGALTLDSLHADTAWSASRTKEHYERTGIGAAYVAAGEDAYGIWLAGAVRPDLTEAQVRELRASPISGDWRRIGGNLELVAALAVNVPGFPIPRPHGLVASGVMTSLVASGMVPPSEVRAPGQPGALSTDDLRYLKRLAAQQREHEADKLASKVFAIRAEALAAKVRKA